MSLIDLTIDVAPVVAFAGRMEAAPTVVGQELTTAMDEATLDVLTAAQAVVPVRTGELRNSGEREVSATTGIVRFTAPHARWVHEGRGEVRPVHARALHWTNPDGSEVFSMRSGPTQPNRFLTDTFARMTAQIVARFQAAGARIAQRLAGGVGA